MTGNERAELAELAEHFAPDDDRPPTLAETLAELTSDGDTAELADGRTLRLRFEPDDQRMPDGDWFGSLEFVKAPGRWDVRRDYGYEHGPRPEGFDGNAEILRGHNFDPIWWQPPVDAKRGSDLFDSLRRGVVDILEYGYCGLILEVLDGTDAYGAPIVTEVASLWGIEPFPDRAYVAEVVRDLAAELDLPE